MSQRRYDIDALRSIAMFLLIFYHLGISFTSIAPQISFVQNKRVADGIWPLLNLMNSWRIPLVFLIAGVALRLSFRKRTKMQIFKERTKVLGLPWLFGTLVLQKGFHTKDLKGSCSTNEITDQIIKELKLCL